MNTSQLNLDFFPFYTSGQKIRVEFPGGYIKQGRVAVSQEPVPRFWLINGCRSMHELVPGCIPKGPALRKSTPIPEWQGGRLPRGGVQVPVRGVRVLSKEAVRC